MKQHITSDDLNQLSEKGKEKLREWWKPVLGDQYVSLMNDGTYGKEGQIDIVHLEPEWENFEKSLPLLSIGKMIEFLSEECYMFTIDKMEKNSDQVEYKWKFYSMGKFDPEGEGDELCDALWQSVKEVLEEEE